MGTNVDSVWGAPKKIWGKIMKEKAQDVLIPFQVRKVEVHKGMSRIIILKELSKKLENERKFVLVSKFVGI